MEPLEETKKKEKNKKKEHREEIKKEEDKEESKRTKKGNKKQAKFLKLQEQVDKSIRDKWAEEQHTLKEQLLEEDQFDWYLPIKGNSEYNDEQEGKGLEKLELIGAVDIR